LWPRASAGGCARAGAGFHFEATEGAPRCAGAVARAGVLPVGGVLETGDGDRAHLEIADIGAIDLGARSRLALEATGPDGHRVSLERGSLHAKVSAPPRLFVVDTPAARAVDLGCEYDLTVGADGAGLLAVTVGKVELATDAQVVEVPAGGSARIVPGRGPGTPWAATATPALRAAIDRIDGGEAGAIGDLLAAVAPTDTLTLFHLLARTQGADRARVYDTIARAIPLPPWIDRARVLAGDQQALDELHEHLEAYWFHPEAIHSW
jgi:hypothetical protein